MFTSIRQRFKRKHSDVGDVTAQPGYLADLLRRMTLKETVKSSDESISWHAHREAERVASPELLEEIQALSTPRAPKAQRSAAYFVLAAISRNSGDTRCVHVLCGYVEAESDKYVLSQLLISLSTVPKPRDVALEPIFKLLLDERWLVRHAAIQALKDSDSLIAEEKVLAFLESTSDPVDKIYCHSTLNQIGTSHAIPLLLASTKSRKRDVKASAISAIAAIEARAAN